MTWRPSPLTIGLTVGALVSVVMVHADPWRGEGDAALMVSTRSAARRLFPNLGEHDRLQASVEIQRVGGPMIRLVPGPDGRHQLFVGDTLLGWADDDAVDGLWGSLRMATSLRAVPPESPVSEPSGSIEIVIGDERLRLILGQPTADGAGIYGTLVHESEGRWVVEAELGAILEQEPKAWLARRLLPLEPGRVAALAWDERALARGEDGLWRVTLGEPSLLLAASAIETRLDRLLGAEIAPLLPRETVAEGELHPWLTVTDADGRQHLLRLGGECPEHPELRIVDRGPGLLGCIRADLVEPWALADPEAGFVEPQLIPYAYGRVLAVDLRRPSARRLRRLGGGWVLEEEGGARIREVPEAEVYRWYTEVATTAVALDPQAVIPSVEVAIESDSGAHLLLRCGEAKGAWYCHRDQGPALRLIRTTPAELAFSADTFAERRLLALDVADARAVEILPGSAGRTVRQGVRLDLGVWRLDAPSHPDGNAALDEVRLETLLATLGGLRADAWVEVPPGALLRTLRVERTPSRDRSTELSLDLYAGCVAHVPGHARAARISNEACAIVSDDLLFVDPLRYWIGRARTIEVEEGGRTTILRQGSGGAWTVDGGDDPNAWSSELVAWDRWRSAGIRRGDPPTPARLRLKIRRVDGITVNAELGPEWLRIAGQDWYYERAAELPVAPEAPAEPAPDEPDDDASDTIAADGEG
ncbi:MAG: hypothetical protein H6711_28430 [Myxococcales bacterium]|nr:hypothetical protein [Myxococcales bacterium]